MSSTITMGEYLFRRIAELGVQHVFGVPGDFNLFLLDELFKVEKLTWLGVCNELNGAYAADGYARIRGLPSCLVTTYAVGELSAMNGIAGAYAEHAGMIHVVGMPTRAVQKARPLLHHTLEPGNDQTVYVGMSAPIRKAHTVLLDDATMAEEIDRVIVAAMRSRLPVYIYVPMDVVKTPLDASRLETPLNTKVENLSLLTQDHVVKLVLDSIKQSSKPAILADVLTIRHGGLEAARRLAKVTQFPTFSAPLSKGVFDEKDPNYNGVYNGTVSFPGVASSIESSDLVLNIGPLLSDSNTGGFTRNIADDKLVLLAHDFCQVKGIKFEGVHFLPVLEQLVEALDQESQAYGIPKSESIPSVKSPLLNDSTSGIITQSYIWQRLGRFLQPHDIVLAEVGTAQYGMPDATFPANVSYITQIFWSSIGYTVGATLGALVAAKETKRPGRVVLIVGDGSLQMSVQEIGSFMRFGFKPIIFVINNNGYSIERAIWGPKQTYNDISMKWDHQKMLEFFGAGVKSRSFACKTVEELEKVLHDPEFESVECIQLCEIFMDQEDYPWRLSGQLDVARKRMAAAAAAKGKET